MGIILAVDLDRCATRQVVAGDVSTEEFLVDADGKVASRGDYIARNGHWVLFNARGRQLVKSMKDTRPLDLRWLAAFGPAAGSVLVGEYDYEDAAYHEVALGQNAPSAQLPDPNNARPLSAPKPSLTIGASQLGDLSVAYHFLDAGDEALWVKIKRGFGNAVVDLERCSKDRKKIGSRARRTALPITCSTCRRGKRRGRRILRQNRSWRSRRQAVISLNSRRRHQNYSISDVAVCHRSVGPRLSRLRRVGAGAISERSMREWAIESLRKRIKRLPA